MSSSKECEPVFSNIYFSIDDAIAEADKVCLRWTCTMTHTGSGLGVSPTNKKLQSTGITIVRVANGKLAAGWQNWDMLGLMHQIRGEDLGPTYIAANTLPVSRNATYRLEAISAF